MSEQTAAQAVGGGGWQWQIGWSLQCWDGFEAERGPAGLDSLRTGTDLWLYEEDGAHWYSIIAGIYCWDILAQCFKLIFTDTSSYHL